MTLDFILEYVIFDVGHIFGTCDFKKLGEKTVYCVENFEAVKNRAMQNTHLFDFQDCGDAYVKVFNEQLSLKRSTNWLNRLLN